MKIDIGQLRLEDLTDMRPAEACLKAVTEVLGVPHHIFFIQVRLVGDAQIAVHDPYDRLGNVRRLNEGRLAPVAVPGHRERYVMVLYPFAE